MYRTENRTNTIGFSSEQISAGDKSPRARGDLRLRMTPDRHSEMKTPETNPDWLADVKEAYDSACERFHSGSFPISSLTELFKTAAILSAERRGITAPQLIQKMNDYVVHDVETDLSNDGSLSDYKFHFVISYIHAHTPACIIDELHADRVMEYVNDHWNLFDVCA